MENKKCNRCGRTLFNQDFRKRFCDDCVWIKMKERSREYRKAHPLYYKKYFKKYYEKNIDYFKKRYVGYINLPGKKEKRNKRMQNYHKKEGILEHKRNYAKLYRLRPKVKDSIIEYRKSQGYKDWYREYMKKYALNRYYSNVNETIKGRLRANLRNVFRKYLKTGKIMSSSKYGVNYQEIIEHLKPFPKNMKEYHIDHIRPLCSFTFVKDDGSPNIGIIKQAFVPENHQWLLASENIRKGGKFLG